MDIFVEVINNLDIFLINLSAIFLGSALLTSLKQRSEQIKILSQDSFITGPALYFEGGSPLEVVELGLSKQQINGRAIMLCEAEGDDRKLTYDEYLQISEYENFSQKQKYDVALADANINAWMGKIGVCFILVSTFLSLVKNSGICTGAIVFALYIVFASVGYLIARVVIYRIFRTRIEPVKPDWYN